MPGDEYASTIRGGLKLKGAKPSGVTKKKKKKEKSKHKDSSDGESSKKSLLQKALEDEDAAAAAASSSSSSKDLIRGEGKEGEGLSEAELRELDPRGDDGKTASERQYEEMRRKRLQDRLAREGVKTHKQRVEELNKYLSTLSEHHDMPRIGPG